MRFAPSSLQLGTPKAKILCRGETLVKTGCAALHNEKIPHLIIENHIIISESEIKI